MNWWNTCPHRNHFQTEPAIWNAVKLTLAPAYIPPAFERPRQIQANPGAMTQFQDQTLHVCLMFLKPVFVVADDTQVVNSTVTLVLIYIHIALICIM